MAKDLVIVESPAKARTIGRYLGKNYEVLSSLGHIRDLPQGELGVDVEDNFKPKYVIPKEKKALVKELDRAVSNASTIYLATDPDREGEAIAWHLTKAANVGKKPVRRVVFHEITEPAIKAAFKDPREIDMALVDAQQTRRILDRLVGYKLSPLLWKKIRGGLSAGRVQSAAIRMLVLREREILAFVPQEYWRILADLAKKGSNGKKKQAAFSAAFFAPKGSKEAKVQDQDAADAILKDLEGASYTVTNVTKRESQRRPTAPFTTSTLQQEAWRKLRFSAQRTMSIAQQLYEGISLGKEGDVGLITYMRTDSPTVSASAVQETRGFIKKEYGERFLPSQPRAYVARTKGAQEAHEAIRPTSVPRKPATLKAHLESAPLRLYELIWKRMVASQMANAVFDSTSVDIETSSPQGAQSYIFKAKGSVQKFAGFLTLYNEGKDEEEEEEGALPALDKGEALDFLGLDPQQKFTQPPARYSEATLVKALEENGIGRPSTYAPTIVTIQARKYVKKEGGLLHPQNLGMLVNDLLQESFPDIIDAKFTATMEEELDEIARGEKPWVPFLKSFYAPFEKAVDTATVSLPKMNEPTDEVCDLCGKPMVIKKGRFGLFLACTGYPECKNTKPHLIKVGVKCPDDGGEIVEKKSRKGKTFYSCANYPNCKFATSLKPIPEPCPNCGGLLGAFPRGGVRCTNCEFKGRRPRAKSSEQPGEEPAPVGAAS